MVNLTSIRNKINTKVFNGLGSIVTLYSVASSTAVDKWGDATAAYTLIGSVSAVPWNLLSDREGFQPFGELSEGDVDMAFKYDQSLEQGYKATVMGKDYVISVVEEFPIKDGNLVKIARLRKLHL